MLIDIFNDGIDFDEFVKEDEGKYEDAINDFIDSTELSGETLEAIEAIDREIKIIAVAEVWCPDCVINIPALEKMHRINSNVSYRCIKREGYEEVLEPFKVEGKVKIPTFLVLDDNGQVKGAFVERPSFVKSVDAEGDQVKKIVTMKAYRKGAYLEQTIRDILDIIKK